MDIILLAPPAGFITGAIIAILIFRHHGFTFTRNGLRYKR